MEYQDSERGREVAAKTREFIDREVIPVERTLLREERTVTEAEMADLQETAREYGVYGPGYPEEYGGLGLDFRERVPVIEESGRCLLGKVAILTEVLDEMHADLLLEVGTEGQKERWLPRIVAGEAIPSISMTEPIQGAGSDPTMIRTTAERDGDEWVINGHKSWVTRGSDSNVIFLYARSSPDDHPHTGLTCFLVPTDTPGVEVVRDIPHMGGGVLGEPHSEITFEDVRVPEENILGEHGQGFKLFEISLDQARVWHGLHKAGMAERALQIAKAYMQERKVFGERLAEKQFPRFNVADAETKLHVWRTFNRSVAERIAAGEEPRVETAMHMYYCSNLAQEIIDTSLQVLGSNGMSKDVPVSNYYETVRGYRVYDGPDEVHIRTIARAAFEDVETWHADPIVRYDEDRS